MSDGLGLIVILLIGIAVYVWSQVNKYNQSQADLIGRKEQLIKDQNNLKYSFYMNKRIMDFANDLVTSSPQAQQNKLAENIHTFQNMGGLGGCDNEYTLKRDVLKAKIEAEKDIQAHIEQLNESVREYNVYRQLPGIPASVADSMKLSPASYDDGMYKFIDREINKRDGLNGDALDAKDEVDVYDISSNGDRSAMKGESDFRRMHANAYKTAVPEKSNDGFEVY